ncbi:MAG: hypothetical protein K9L28_01845 [Synergistales bacterium]|nr:hypothetical protein [Synergistales bacterium]
MFLLYDIFSDAPPKPCGQRENTVREMDHGAGNKMQAVLSLVEDADLLLARQVSPNFRRMAAVSTYQPVVVRTESIDDALEVLRASFDRLEELLSQRSRGEPCGEVPVFGEEPG